MSKSDEDCAYPNDAHGEHDHSACEDAVAESYALRPVSSAVHWGREDVRSWTTTTTPVHRVIACGLGKCSWRAEVLRRGRGLGQGNALAASSHLRSLLLDHLRARHGYHKTSAAWLDEKETCGDCGDDGWVCGGGPGCTFGDNQAGTEPDHVEPCPNAIPCDCEAAP